MSIYILKDKNSLLTSWKSIASKQKHRIPLQCIFISGLRDGALPNSALTEVDLVVYGQLNGEMAQGNTASKQLQPDLH